MQHLKPIVAVALCAVALAGCASTDEAPATGSSSSAGSAQATGSPEPASPAPASSDLASSAVPTTSPAAWQPSDGLHVKVVVQFDEAIPPEDCGQQGTEERVGVGSVVTLKVADGSTASTQPLREVFEGQPYGPQGYTFGGWGDLEPNENGDKVTFACFYVADFADVPVSEAYVASVEGGQDIAYDVPLLTENDGWITQPVS